MDAARVRGARNAAGMHDRSSRCVGIHGHLRVAVLDGWVVAPRPPHVADETASVAPSAGDAAFGIRPRHHSAVHLSEHASRVTRAAVAGDRNFYGSVFDERVPRFSGKPAHELTTVDPQSYEFHLSDDGVRHARKEPALVPSGNIDSQIRNRSEEHTSEL